MEEKHMPKLLDEREVLLAAHDIMGDVMEWAFDDKGAAEDALNYIFGMHDLVSKLLREINGNGR